jgi:DNA-binding transcriptional LysR family regulator
MPPHVELRQLRYFVAVAEELHFGRAAARVGIAQPPLSQQIQRLERELGVLLFTRTNRRVALTPAGRIFLDEARNTLAQAERAVDLVQRAGRGEAGKLAVGFVGSACYGLLPRVLRAFRAGYPGVELALHELSSARQAVALREGRIDVGFVRPTLNEPALRFETILREPLMAVLPEAHPLARLERVPLESLAGEGFVIFPRQLGPGLFARIVAACGRAGFAPEIVQEAVEQTTIVSLVAVGMGVSLLPASIEYLRWPGVACRPLTEGTPDIEMALAWRGGDTSPVLGCFLEVVRGVTIG